MPFALLTTDIRKDPCINEVLAPQLDQLGFSSDLISPLPRITEALRILSLGSGHLDAVIMLHTGSITSGTTNPWYSALEIRDLPDDLCLQGSVKTKSIPLLLVIDSEQSGFPRPEASIPWLRTYDLTRNSEHLGTVLLDLIHDWKTNLLSELESVGYAVTLDVDDGLSVSPAFRRPDAEGEILAQSANLQALRRSRYLILSADVLGDLAPYQELQFLLNNYRQIAKQQKTKPEEVFQKFFEQHPSMIQRDMFAEHWARPRLRLYPDPRQYIEPDFVLKPRVAPSIGTKWQVLDIKLPDVPLTTGQGFHPGFSAKLLRAVQQLYDYRDRFNREESRDELLSHFGMHPRNPRLAVLIGRGPEREEVEDLTRSHGSLKMLDIEIVTYDEILETHAKDLLFQFGWLRSLS